MIFYPKIVRCNNSSCKHILYKNKGEKQLTDEQLGELLKKGRTRLIKGFKNKDGIVFDASLKFDDSYNIIYDFSDNNNKGNGKRKKT